MNLAGVLVSDAGNTLGSCLDSFSPYISGTAAAYTEYIVAARRYSLRELSVESPWTEWPGSDTLIPASYSAGGNILLTARWCKRCPYLDVAGWFVTTMH